jgi:hypothetical protein
MQAEINRAREDRHLERLTGAALSLASFPTLNRVSSLCCFAGNLRSLLAYANFYYYVVLESTT